MLDQAAEYDPESSEVHCYRGGNVNVEVFVHVFF